MGSFDDTMEEEPDLAIDFSVFDRPEDEFPTSLSNEDDEPLVESEAEMESETDMEMEVEHQGISPSAV
jgi:hypothetical protein